MFPWARAADAASPPDTSASPWPRGSHVASGLRAWHPPLVPSTHHSLRRPSLLALQSSRLCCLEWVIKQHKNY
jgi:hypothetical protein